MNPRSPENPGAVVSLDVKIENTPEKAQAVHDAVAAAMKDQDQIPEISYDDFVKTDIRVGVIKSAERIPKKDRLLKLEVDLGSLGMRTIVAGIAEAYTPEALVPPKPIDSGGNMLGTFTHQETSILVVTNLAPRKVGGIMSHGMLLAGKDATGKLSLATCPNMPVGTQIG